MPMGTQHRLEGLSLNFKRELVLQIDDGGVWALDHERPAQSSSTCELSLGAPDQASTALTSTGSDKLSDSGA